MLEDRLSSLKRKHQELHTRIEVLEAEKCQSKYVTPLKKEKLRMKDEMASIERKIAANS